ncbi:MAG: hypothetical protein H8D88_00360 [Bacteroidetes bacterium]|nr:hypothetical protein [Bacteroidota bacterium]
MKTNLFSTPKGSKNKRDLYVVITDDGDLILDGCDSGPAVLEHFGESDYEYAVTVKADNLVKVFDLLTDSKQEYRQSSLLELIRKRFSHEYGFSEFKDLLEKQHIDFDSWSF